MSKHGCEPDDTWTAVPDEIVNAVENEVGIGCGAWDCVPPKQIIAAAWKFLPNAPASATEGRP